ncbi:acyl-CoA dehydrogenase C-terminal domain-containing protein [Rubellimicrobium aerolatum]|uniref:Acyl-CoA dehydrogenase C-terminal domain-containing protein n=1 Tax=Rubellimicrobium aerolatum TaxID=490979 RepID=A0ABW0SB51_9RHOB|nr:acyl-CoA dehydrogenase C-terminal domain-containing protein [Rubellimicrobium aerolatum]MBP1805376.1 alkylation response protein AidB-like acyl-CoA dehydrogenase [Rubellimicrobium aerolatum]
MPIYQSPIKDMQFVLHEVLRVGEDDIPGFPDLDPDTTRAILEEAGRVAAEVLLPLNAPGDREGCVLENGVVRTPPGFKDAMRAMREGGWTCIDCAPEHGGQGLPYLMHTAAQEAFVSANMAFNMYQGLTHGAYSAILLHGTESQKALWLPRLATCEWTGTMNLTEPQAGTDLGLLRTRAEPRGDGTYAITGQKIFISSGEHDLAENIVHLVLARIPGGPEGTRGLSLFIVPKVLVREDGTLGPRNALSCGKLEAKMGIHGNATCAMNYDGATGYLLGEEHKGMRAMFTMMNEARLGVALQGYAQAEIAYQNAAHYAKGRLQGRDLAARGAGGADPIIVHPDVRRSLMDQRSFVEGARAFTYWGASLIDRAQRTGDAEAEGLISLLTPVLKGFQTDKGFEMCVAAQQLYGGHGYIEDWGMSQFVRDARIAMIYEGANGIQALDLVGRKLGAEGGRPIMAFFDMVKTFLKAHEGDAELKATVLDPLKAASKDLQAAAMFFLDRAAKAPHDALAGANDFLHLMGHVCLGYMWARMAVASRAALAAGTDDPAFHEAKIATARYYAARQLPATAMHLARITSGAAPVMALEAASF